jgi:hypothetical protein
MADAQSATDRDASTDVTWCVAAGVPFMNLQLNRQHRIITEHGQEHVTFCEYPGKTVVFCEQDAAMIPVLHRPDHVTYTACHLQHQRGLQLQSKHLDFTQTAFDLHDRYN